MEELKPLVVESYRHKQYKGTTYKRRLRISPYNAIEIDSVLGTNVFGAGTQNRFAVLDLHDIKKACEVLQITFKPINTYFDIDLNMCSFQF